MDPSFIRDPSAPKASAQVADYRSEQDATKSSQVSQSLHLVPLVDQQWAFWQWICLRGAGFPSSFVLQLADTECASEVDRVWQYEEELDQVEQELLERYKRIVPEDDFALQNVLSASWKLLSKGQFEQITLDTLPVEFRLLFQRYQERYERLVAQWARAQVQFDRAQVRHYDFLREIASNHRFREAVLWQNASAVKSGLDAFLHRSPEQGITSRHRDHAHLIAKYLTRYCTKNDSIGFFGPVGWARWCEDAAVPFEARPGAELLAQRTVYFETWGIDTIGELLARDPAFRPWAIPRPLPALRLDGQQLEVPFTGPMQLSPLEASVFAACDGQRRANEIVRFCMARQDPPTTEQEVYSLLEKLCAQKCIAWSFEVSPEARYPEQELLRLLSAIQPATLRQRACAILDRLDEKRAAIAAAVGHEQELRVALTDMDQTFSMYTGQAATRMAGEMYAARTLVYEDCRRDVDVALGPALREALEEPLLLLLHSARWFTVQAARAYTDAYREVYRNIVRQTGERRVCFALFWSWMQSLMNADATQAPLHAVVREFQRRWVEVLQVPDMEQSHLHYTSTDLAPRVQRFFAADTPGWRLASYHSPDILISATDPAAIARGEYTFVMGEFHQALNTFDMLSLTTLHPDPSVLVQAFCHDLPESLIAPYAPRHFMHGKRTQPIFLSEKDWRFVYGTDTAGYDPQRTLLYGRLILEEQDGELIVTTSDELQQFKLLHVLENFLSLLICDHYRPLPAAQHTPRLSFDRLVVCRESWSFSPEDLPFLACKQPLEEYTMLRRWAGINALPRFLFVKVPGERKPFYVDIDSPISIQILVKALRRAQKGQYQDQAVLFSEMLPDPEHCWLMDAQGNHYTSELRIVAVDRSGR